MIDAFGILRYTPKWSVAPGPRLRRGKNVSGAGGSLVHCGRSSIIETALRTFFSQGWETETKRPIALQFCTQLFGSLEHVQGPEKRTPRG
jgi:hypothetical protein